MTASFLTDANNDLYVAADGNLAFGSGLSAVVQSVQNATQAIRGECVFDIELGLPNFETIWNGAPNVGQYESALRSAILAVPGVRDILSLEIAANADAVGYTARILTDFGAGVVNG